MPRLGDLVARLRLRDDTQPGVDAAEGRIDSMFTRLGASAAAVGAAFARGLVNALEDIEQRFNTLEQQLGRISGDERALADELTSLGFDADAVAAGTAITRQYGLDQGLAEDVASLQTAGINPRFVPQLGRAFDIDDPGELSRQLNAAFDVSTRSGADPEELFTEIADNPEVYQAFGTLPQAAAFIGSQPLIPSEVTNQLNAGALVPEQTDVDADVAALSAVSPSFEERSRGRLSTQPGLASTQGALESVPVFGEFADLFFGFGARLGELIRPEAGNRTQRADIDTFDVPVSDLLLEIETRDAAAAARVERIANRVDLDRRNNASALDIPG